MFVSAFSCLALAFAVSTPMVACHDINPINAPIARCDRACADVAKHCSWSECRRGCEFILDRLVEREDGNVVRCVGRRKPTCGDRVWAYCAARVGAFADGGPAVPPGIPDDEWD